MKKSDSIDIREEPSIKKLTSRMPQKIAESFSEEQLLNLKIALGSRKWGKHKVDFRGSFRIPMVTTRIYYVLLMGKNHRELSRQEKTVSSITLSLLLTLFIVFSIMFGILALYLIKSALGIDLIEGFSFGVWTWFKQLWQ